MRNPFDLLIGAVLFIGPELTPYFWPAVSFVLALIVIVLLGI